ncbi:MAG: hypothetical protein JNK61_12870 [Bacteroidia bacterium]|nr:hypothetical protein [Bacteroidia bacterium]HQV00389.1 hypothetical protein [Bacteroidia bacterium]
MHTQQQFQSLQDEHHEWLAKLQFYKSDLAQHEQVLEQKSVLAQSTDAKAMIEHFQNQFILQREVLDILRHDIKQFENELVHLQQHGVDKTKQGIQMLKDSVFDQLQTFEKLYHDLRHEFVSYAQ